MALSSGTRLGAYEITHVLGAGGMGEVYRARDSRLGRGVAIKIILEQAGMEGDRVARFEREAKVLAAINHPNIAALYGLEEADGRHFLVMELVEGETLAERIQRGALPVEDALRVALQIVEALEAAHEKGIVHRDLKPANVKITPDDKVKVLDFGLAKAMEAEASGNVANSPTLSMMATNAGVILGTAAYMSPEQAKGFAADHRSDVFSFGVVLYEMLTGRQPFQGETAPEILASVLVREPELQRLPPDVNPRITELLRRCLEKQPKRRWQAIGDLRAELEAIASAPRALAAAAPAAHVKPLWKRALPVAAAAIVTGAAAGTAAWILKPEPPRAVSRFASVLPSNTTFTGLARRTLDISPDGSLLVYTANAQLHLRALSSFTVTPVAGTDAHVNVTSPTFSPDGRSVVFYAVADQTLKRIAVAGGAAVTVCPVGENPVSIAWADDDSILYSVEGGIMRVPASGGAPQKILSVEPAERVQRAELLPGADKLLLTVLPSSDSSSDRWQRAKVVVQPLSGGVRKVVAEGATDARYLPTGHLAYVVSGILQAVPFDLSRSEARGTPVPVVEGVRRAVGITGLAFYAVSKTGTLAYVPGPAGVFSAALDIGLFDRKGAATPLKLPPGPYETPRISPDGRRIVMTAAEPKQAAIVMYDLSHPGALQRFTFGGTNRHPIWSGDGKRVVFQSDREGDLGIFWQAADGASAAERLTKAGAGEAHVPESWQPHGDVLLFSVAKGSSEYALWTYSARGRRAAPFPGVVSGVPIDAVFSPDGKWIAYTSGSAAGSTVYVQPFPATGALYELVRAPTDGPHHALWSPVPDRPELIVNPRPNTMDAVSVTTRPAFAFGPREALPKGYITGPNTVRRPFDMAPDGRILGLITPGDSGPLQPQINVVLNWFEELKARVPGR